MRTSPIIGAASRSVAAASTLRAALEEFLFSLSRERAATLYSVVANGLNIRICRIYHKSDIADRILYTDLDFFIDLTAIIREFGGFRWSPRHISFQFYSPIGEIARLHFPNTRFLTNQPASWIELPRSFLKLPRQPTNSMNLNHLAATGTLGVGDLSGFVHKLTRTLRNHADDGYLDIDSAARLVCMSVRTLQRNLAKAGLTYSKVVEYARFEAAAEMLARPDLKIIDIAYSLGYEDPSHFSRAFRRMIGQSPREFRLKRLAKNAA